MMTLLTGLRDALAKIDGVASCAVGLEAAISPADYPLIRVVPSRVSDGAAIGRRNVEAMIYFGVNISEAEGGLEGVYASLFDLEALIRTVLNTNGGHYIETITDEDRLDTYKLMAVRCDLEG